MERFENLLDFINELNENGRIQYDDYSRLFDLVQEFAGAEEAINAAATDIAALLWLNGNCEYCEHGEKEEFCGANRWHCRLGNGIDCRPVWRGAATKASLPEIHKAEPTLIRAKPSRAETMFGPKEAWAIPDRAEAEETTPKTYKGFLLIRCAQCGELRGFCAKQPICKCGKHFKYRTNFEEDVFTYSCLSCGAPVDLAYNKEARAYQTVR